MPPSSWPPIPTWPRACPSARPRSSSGTASWRPCDDSPALVNGSLEQVEARQPGGLDGRPAGHGLLPRRRGHATKAGPRSGRTTRPPRAAPARLMPDDQGPALALLPRLGDGQDRGLHVGRLPHLRRPATPRRATRSTGSRRPSSRPWTGPGCTPPSASLDNTRGRACTSAPRRPRAARSGGATCRSSRADW